MPRTAHVAPWKTREELLEWLQEADSKEAYQRRLVIWMAVVHPMSATQVAKLLGISVQSVWKWLGEYNHSGPEGLERVGRGGRRKALLSLSAEKSLVAKIRSLQTQSPHLPLSHVLPEVERLLKRKVPLHYLYRLMRRWLSEDTTG